MKSLAIFSAFYGCGLILPESRTRDDIRALSRPGYAVVVKRECSDGLMADILMFVYGYGKGRYKGSATFNFAAVPLYDLMAEFERDDSEKDSSVCKKRQLKPCLYKIKYLPLQKKNDKTKIYGRKNTDSGRKRVNNN